MGSNGIRLVKDAIDKLDHPIIDLINNANNEPRAIVIPAINLATVYIINFQTMQIESKFAQKRNPKSPFT